MSTGNPYAYRLDEVTSGQFSDPKNSVVEMICFDGINTSRLALRAGPVTVAHLAPPSGLGVVVPAASCGASGHLSCSVITDSLPRMSFRPFRGWGLLGLAGGAACVRGSHAITHSNEACHDADALPAPHTCCAHDWSLAGRPRAAFLPVTLKDTNYGRRRDNNSTASKDPPSLPEVKCITFLVAELQRVFL